MPSASAIGPVRSHLVSDIDARSEVFWRSPLLLFGSPAAEELLFPAAHFFHHSGVKPSDLKIAARFQHRWLADIRIQKFSDLSAL